MQWSLLFVHGLNPFIILVTLMSLAAQNESKPSDQADKRKETRSALESTFENAFTVYFTGVFMYSLIWLLPHYVINEFFHSGFDLAEFFGNNEPPTYFIPYVFGGYFLLNWTILRPMLARRSDGLKAINAAMNTVLFLASAYCLLVFYLKWL